MIQLTDKFIISNDAAPLYEDYYRLTTMITAMQAQLEALDNCRSGKLVQASAISRKELLVEQFPDMVSTFKTTDLYMHDWLLMHSDSMYTTLDRFSWDLELRSLTYRYPYGRVAVSSDILIANPKYLLDKNSDADFDRFLKYVLSDDDYAVLIKAKQEQISDTLK